MNVTFKTKYRTVNKLKSEIETLKNYKEKYRKRFERSHFKIKLKETEKSQASSTTTTSRRQTKTLLENANVSKKGQTI
jgi:hypothetical protein